MRLFGQQKLITSLCNQIQTYFSLESVDHPPALLIAGSQGAGKTALLEAASNVEIEPSGCDFLKLSKGSVEGSLSKFLSQEIKPENMEKWVMALCDRATTKPICFLVDDFDRFVSQEQDFLINMLRQVVLSVKPGRILFVISTDSADNQAHAKVAEPLQSLNPSWLPIVFPINPLDSEAAKELVVERAGLKSIKPENMRLLYRCSSGNPTKLLALVQYCRRQKMLRQGNGIGALEVLLKKIGGPTDWSMTDWSLQRFDEILPNQKKALLILAFLHNTYNRSFIIRSGVIGEDEAKSDGLLETLIEFGFLKEYEDKIAFNIDSFRNKLLEGRKISQLRSDLITRLQKLSTTPDLQVAEEILLLKLETYEAEPPISEILRLASDLDEKRLVAKASRLYHQLAAKVVLPSFSVEQASRWLDSLTILAEKLISIGSYSVAAEVLEVSLRAYDAKDIGDGEIGKRKREVYTFLRLQEQRVRLSGFLGDFELVQKITDESMILAKQYQFTDLYGAFASPKAYSLMTLGRYDECLEFVDASKSLIEEATPTFVQLLITEGHVHRLLKNYAAAEKTYRNAISISKKFDYVVGVANGDQSLGVMYREQGRAPLAEKHFYSAQHIFEQTGKRDGVISCKFSLSQLALEKMEFDHSLELIGDSLAAFRRINNKHRLADAMQRLGRIQIFVGKRHEGMSHLRFALWMFEDLSVEHLSGGCLWELFRCECLQSNFTDAKVHLEKLRLLPVEKLQGGLSTKSELAESLMLAFERPSEPSNFSDLYERNERELDMVGQIELLCLLARLQLFHLLPFSVGERLMELSSQVAPLWRSFALQGYLLLMEAHLVDFDSDIVQSYLAPLELICQSLEGDQQHAFSDNWKIDYFKRAIATDSAVSRDVLEVGVAKETAAELDEWLGRFFRVVDSLYEANTKPLLVKRLLQGLIETLPISRVAVVFAESGKAVDVGESKSIDAIPKAYRASGMLDSGRRFAVRTDSLVRQLFLKVADDSQEKLLSERIEGRYAFAVKLDARHSELGFIFAEFQTEAPSSNHLLLLKNFAQTAGLILREKDFFGVVESGLDSSPPTDKVNRRELSKLVYKSREMSELVQQVEALAGSEANVLIVGESGTGKELLAQSVHLKSPRSEKTFVIIDCSSVPESLFEAQFFGYVRGAFTGAHEDRSGYFQAADGGTLFLDNIAALSLASQAKLLRAIQEGEVRPVGSLESSLVDVRFIAADSHQLQSLVDRGEFRSDLFFRLEVLQLALPPLRQRKEDIPLLLSHFLDRYASSNPIRLSKEALKKLQAYPWPGNVRELGNEVERLQLFKKQGLVRSTDLSPKIQGMQPEGGEAQVQGLKDRLAELERQLIEKELENHSGNVSRTAKALNLSRPNLIFRMHKLNIH